MANKTLCEYFVPIVANVPIGLAVSLGDVNFKLKTGLIKMVQTNPFCELPSKDTNVHFQHFLEQCDTVNIEGVTPEIIRFRLFPFSLLGRTK
jgi:hypothetical protein